MGIRLEFVATVAAAVLAAGCASAGSIPYPTPDTPNPVIYTFTAATTGDITAYFAGSGASYDEQIGLLADGVQVGTLGLDDHSSTVGQSFDFGHVTAGETLVFFDVVSTTSNTWYTDPTLNSDGGNHVYSTSATAGQVYGGSPAGTYIGFEDEAFGQSDYNYFDDTFIIANTTTSVPEPAIWAIMLAGFLGAGAMLRGARRKPTGATAPA